MWLDEVQSRIKEHRQLKEPDLRESVSQAFGEYSGYYPYHHTVQMISDGTRLFDLPADWEEGFSTIVHIEYPLAEVLLESNPLRYDVPHFREASDYTVHTSGESFSKIILAFDVPVGETLRMKYTTSYSYDAADNIPTHHRSALLNLITSYLLMKLAAVYTKSTRYDLEAEETDYGSRPPEYLAQANWYRNLWEQMMGIGKYSSEDDGAFDVGNQLGFTVAKVIPMSRTHRLFVPSYERNGYGYYR